MEIGNYSTMEALRFRAVQIQGCSNGLCRDIFHRASRDCLGIFS